MNGATWCPRGRVPARVLVVLGGWYRGRSYRVSPVNSFSRSPSTTVRRRRRPSIFATRTRVTRALDVDFEGRTTQKKPTLSGIPRVVASPPETPPSPTRGFRERASRDRRKRAECHGVRGRPISVGSPRVHGADARPRAVFRGAPRDADARRRPPRASRRAPRDTAPSSPQDAPNHAPGAPKTPRGAPKTPQGVPMPPHEATKSRPAPSRL